MFTIDAHLDLSMNAMEWNRDLRKSVFEIREREQGLTDKPDRGKGVVAFPELHKASIGLVVATQIARYVAPGNPLPGWHSAEQAWAQTQAQLAWYKTMEECGEMKMLKDIDALEQHIALWMNDANDKKIKVLIERDAVIGGVLDAWMMVPDWIRGKSLPEQMNCNLEKVIDHIDHICQLAGNALHVGIGSDLDGGYGKEQCPYDIETIADLQRIPSLLAKRGYSQDDITNIMYGNWLRFLRKAWS